MKTINNYEISGLLKKCLVVTLLTALAACTKRADF